MTPEVAALRIGQGLREAETRIDLALLEIGKLISIMAEARIETDSPAHVGHRAFSRISDTSAKLMAARQDLIRAHADMLKVAEERGDMLMDCPNGALTEPLREVA